MAANKRTNEEWRALLAEQRASGQSQEAWCAANGVNLYTLRDRASRLKRMDRETGPQLRAEQPESASTGWVEVRPEKLPEGTASIRIGYGGFSVAVTDGFDAELLTEVLRAVSRACC